MKIRIVGGGPAGLFYAYLMQRDRIQAGAAPHDIEVFERDAEDATYGWGVVFSDVALAFVRDIAPELHEAGCTPQEIYGTAEGLINMTRLDDPDDVLLESSGSPVSEWDEIKVVDDLDREVPDGQPGELLTRGPYTIRGYYDAPERWMCSRSARSARS